jgi:hypothetical protein
VLGERGVGARAGEGRIQFKRRYPNIEAESGQLTECVEYALRAEEWRLAHERLDRR